MTSVRALSVCALLLAASAAAAAGNASPSYTAAQAWRGRLAYYEHCAECHGGNLGGVTGPALAGDDGNLQWQTGKAVYDYLRVEMPAGNGGGVPTGTYVDIMAFLYQQHHKPEGTRALEARAIESDLTTMGW